MVQEQQDDERRVEALGPESEEQLNEVRLRGRVAAQPEPRRLPSGACLVTWRLVVPRPPQAPVEGRRRVTVDSFDLTAWEDETQQVALGLRAGDVVEVVGALRRRFFRGPGGVRSRYEVHVRSVLRARPGDDLARAAAPACAIP